MVRGPNRGLTFLTRLCLVRDPVKKKKKRVRKIADIRKWSNTIIYM
jgi:hypothetical protein